jgi:6-pyruvoyltetrahydropterin/6-carboxytetrahydropterin synthase
MFTSRQFFTAESGFDSARHVPGLPIGHPSRGLHGHGFRVNLRALLPEGWASFPGAEAHELAERLRAVVAPLDKTLLNDLVEEPGDVQLARWICARAQVPSLLHLGVRNSATSGVELDASGQAWVWRRYVFQSAHRLPHVPLGHKCGRMHGHGFEAVVLARMGEAEASHLAADLLDEHWAPLHHALNYACLNELPGLENPTSEILARWIWDRLGSTLPGLASVKVYETASCGAHYDGLVHRIWKDFHVDSALRLRHAPAGHPLARLHGHTWTLRLHLSGPLEELRGWALDFGEVKEKFRPVFKALDHHALHEQLPDLPDCDPATVASWTLAQARNVLPAVDRVDLFDSHGAGAIACAHDVVPAPGL